MLLECNSIVKYTVKIELQTIVLVPVKWVVHLIAISFTTMRTIPNSVLLFHFIHCYESV